MEKHPSFSDSNMLGALHQGRLKVYVPESTTRGLWAYIAYLSNISKFVFYLYFCMFFFLSVTYVAKFWISPETSDFYIPNLW